MSISRAVASLGEIKALAAALPPSERVMGAEVADVVSGFVALVHHGDGILKAAEQGSQGVLDFLHNEIAQFAQENGHPAPVRGQVQTEVSTQGAVDGNTAALAAQVAELTKLVQQLTGATQVAAAGTQEGGAEPAEPAPPSETVTPGSELF